VAARLNPSGITDVVADAPQGGMDSLDEAVAAASRQAVAFG
jgi:hypothetical protein